MNRLFKFLSLILTVSIVFSMMAYAATYRNDTDNVIMVKNSAGQETRVKPGKSIETVYPVTDTGMAKIADTPYYNPLTARHTISSTGPGDDQTVTLNPGTSDYIYIWKVSGGNATVYYDATANTPAIAVLRPGDRFQHDLKGRAAQLIIQFDAAGTCEVLEATESIE